MSTAPESILSRLQDLAQNARHHPQPGLAVSLLAQLLLDVVAELAPLYQRYALLIRTGGASEILAELEKHLQATELQLGATALPGAQAGTYQDLQPDAGSTTGEGGAGQAGHDPTRDTTGTAG